MLPYNYMHRKPLYISLVLAALLLVLHLYALHMFLYWHHRWFDIPMHILGGAAIGAFLLAFFSTRHAKFYFFCMALVVVGWEVFEYIGHISTAQPNYWFDTAKDMVDGLIGAAVSFYFARRSLWH